MPTLLLIVVIDLIGFGLVIPLLPFYAERFHATPDVVTLVLAIYSLTQLLSAPVWGHLSDRFGRRPVLLTSLAGVALSYLWLASADSLWTLFAARALCGLMAGNITAAFAYVADITTPENRARGMGLMGAAWGLGFIAGPALGGILAGPHAMTADFETPSLVAAGLSATALLLGLILLKESLPAEVRARNRDAKRVPMRAVIAETFKCRELAFWIGLTFAATLVLAGMETTFAMWTERTFGWGPRPNGYLLAFIGVLNALIQGGLTGRLTKRFGERRLVVQGALALAVGCALFSLSTTPAMLIAVMVIMSYGFSVMFPAMNSLVSRAASSDRQGGVLGLSRSAATLGRVIGPAIAGVLFAFLGKDAPYVASAVLMVGIFWLAVRRRPVATDESVQPGAEPAHRP